MRWTVSRVFASMAIAIILVDVEAWGECSDYGNAAFLPAADEVWRQHSEDPAYFGLYRNGIQVAGYDTRSGIYRTYDAATRTWGPSRRTPWRTHGCGCVPDCYCEDGCNCAGAQRCSQECTCVAKKRIPNYGVDLSRLNGTADEVVTLNGRKVSKERIPDILSGGPLVDDSHKAHLTVIGSDLERKQVLDDLARPPLSKWKDRLLVHSYPPNHWTMTRSGFFSGGHPTIYLEAPDGAVLHRQDDYEDGAPALAEAIRRADASYDPKKDPDLRKLFRFPDSLSKIPSAAWLLLLGLVFGLFQKGQP